MLTFVEMDEYLVIITRRRTSRLSIRVTKAGEVRVSAPRLVPRRVINEFVASHREWIEKALERVGWQQRGREAFYAQLDVSTPALRKAAAARLAEIVTPMVERHVAALAAELAAGPAHASASGTGDCRDASCKRATRDADAARRSGTDATRNADAARRSGTDATRDADAARGSGTYATRNADAARGSGTDATRDADAARRSGTDAARDADAARRSGTDATRDADAARRSGTDATRDADAARAAAPLAPSAISYRCTKTRWGSCNPTTRRINFSTYLLLLPDWCIEHVVVHELCHLLVPDHSPRFYALMDRHFPRWKEARRETRRLAGGK